MPDYVNFLGHRLQVASEDDLRQRAESGETTVYVVSRVTDSGLTAIAESGVLSDPIARMLRKIPCERCFQECWYNPGAAVPMGEGVLILCTHCMIEIVKGHQAGQDDAQSS